MPHSARRAFVAFFLLIYVPAYAVFAVMIAERANALPGAILAVLYAVLGLVWIVPLRPLFKWMHGGPRNPGG